MQKNLVEHVRRTRNWTISPISTAKTEPEKSWTGSNGLIEIQMSIYLLLFDLELGLLQMILA